MRMSLFFSAAVLISVVAKGSQESTNKGSSASVRTPKAQKSQSQVGKLSSPQPTPEIERLAKALVGKWSIDIKTDPNESMPNALLTRLQRYELLLMGIAALVAGSNWWWADAKPGRWKHNRRSPRHSVVFVTVIESLRLVSYKNDQLGHD